MAKFFTKISSFIVVVALVLSVSVGAVFASSTVTLTNEKVSAVGITVTSKGKIYVADNRFDCIYTMSKSGDLKKVCAKGFGEILGICNYKKGIAIADAKKNAVFYFDGKKLKKIAKVTDPAGVAADKKGNLYVTSRKDAEIKIIDSKKKVKTLISSSDIQMSEPTGITCLGDKLYVSDSGNHRILEVGLDGTAKIFAGSAKGIDGNKTGGLNKALFSSPMGLSGNGDYLYVADTGNSSVKRIDIKKKNVDEIIEGYSLNNGLSPAGPVGIFAAKGVLYIGDTFTMEVLEYK